MESHPITIEAESLLYEDFQVHIDALLRLEFPLLSVLGVGSGNHFRNFRSYSNYKNEKITSPHVDTELPFDKIAYSACYTL